MLQLLDMGFPREHAIEALQQTGSLEQAAEWALTHPPRISQVGIQILCAIDIHPSVSWNDGLIHMWKEDALILWYYTSEIIILLYDYWSDELIKKTEKIDIKIHTYNLNMLTFISKATTFHGQCIASVINHFSTIHVNIFVLFS